jgi:integrase
LAYRPGEVVRYAEVDEKANRWAKRRSKSPKMRRRYSRAQFRRYAASWLRFLGRLEVPITVPQRFDEQIAAFADFLARDKDATISYQRRSSPMEPVTMRVILLLLYGTGLRVSEVIRLNQTDVDLVNSLLTVRQTKFHKTRLVPFGLQIRRACPLSPSASANRSIDLASKISPQIKFELSCRIWRSVAGMPLQRATSVWRQFVRWPASSACGVQNISSGVERCGPSSSSGRHGRW